MASAANELALTFSLPLKIYRVASDGDLIDPENIWHQLYEVTTTGAVLVRPDGHVAWRSKASVDNPKNLLHKIINTKILMKG